MMKSTSRRNTPTDSFEFGPRVRCHRNSHITAVAMVKRSPMNAIGENSRRTSFTATKFRPQIITVASIIRSVVPQARVREGAGVDVTGRLSSDRR